MVLMRSGLGPVGHLRELGVPVLQDMQGVGANLMYAPVFTPEGRPMIERLDEYRSALEENGHDPATKRMTQSDAMARPPYCLLPAPCCLPPHHLPIRSPGGRAAVMRREAVKSKQRQPERNHFDN